MTETVVSTSIARSARTPSPGTVLWNAADPNSFAHRTTFGTVLVVVFGFVVVAAVALGRLNRADAALDACRCRNR
ncbi:hypothetical protein [Streptomyces sp. NWU49]|uniref:hypothetical protein n=1 Tax=Streptomyces sp. NWU49 TaxID=2201153 RepID=UPI0015E80018|nr:hypothetical protein [Streptomyces sp. NWU49]